MDDAYPLHRAVWRDHPDKLSELIDGRCAGDRTAMEKRDPRGRTALLLAVALNRRSRINTDHVAQLASGADANAERDYWSATHEATCAGDPDLLRLVLKHRTAQRRRAHRHSLAGLMNKLKETGDFYVEMTWEFRSWLPFVGRMCPSDSYKIYKRGGAVRVDANLSSSPAVAGVGPAAGGKLTYLFLTREDGRAELCVLDHAARTVLRESLGHRLGDQSPTDDGAQNDDDDDDPSPSELAGRLSSPVATTYVDVDRVQFASSDAASGGGLAAAVASLWGGDVGQKRTETVDGWPARVYTAHDVHLVQKTRSEHMSDEDRREWLRRRSEQFAGSAAAAGVLQRFVHGAEVDESDVDPSSEQTHNQPEKIPSDPYNPHNITEAQYFDAEFDLDGKDVGAPRRVKSRSNAFTATLWLANPYPISLQDQIGPIIDFLSADNAHMHRLRRFISLQLPAGFPVQIEIPLFVAVAARATFRNVNASNQRVDGVTPKAVEASATANSPSNSLGGCELSPALFEVPDGYSERGSPAAAGDYRAGAVMDEDMMLQMAIEQSLLDGGDQTQVDGSIAAGDLDRDRLVEDPDAAQLRRVLAESERLEAERQRQLQQENDELLRVLELSKTEM